MDDLVFAGNKALYLVFDPVRVADDCRNDYRPPGRVIPDGNAITGTDAAFWH